MLVWDRSFVAAVEHGESNAVEAGQTLLGADPEVAIRCSGDRLNGALRQPLRYLPIVENVLARLHRRVERACQARDGHEQHYERAATCLTHTIGPHTFSAARHIF